MCRCLQFVHVPALSPISYTNPTNGLTTKYNGGTDSHGPQKLNGYWGLQYLPDGTTTQLLPGITLGDAVYTINNPDSYVGPAMQLGMMKKQWVLTQSDENGRALKWKFKKIENYVEPAWGTEWPNEPPNWTNEHTPYDRKLRATRRDGMLSNDTMGMESSTTGAADEGAAGTGLVALSS
jgi:hypothetical protein